MPTLDGIKEAIIANFRKSFPGEKVSKSPFSVYLLEVHATLIYKILKKVESGREK